MTADQCTQCQHYLPTIDGLCSMCRPKPAAQEPSGGDIGATGEPCNCDQARELAAQIKWRDKTIANQSAELERVTKERDALPVGLSEIEAAKALIDAGAFDDKECTGWLPTNAEAAATIYAAGFAIVRVR